MIRHLGLILVDLIPKVYNVPRIIRVIKEDGTNYGVPVNQPVQVIQSPQQPGKPNTPEYRPVDPNAPMQGQQQGMPPQQPQLSDDQRQELSGLIKVFDLAAGKYDVTCESGPSFTTRREEAANQMMQFVQAFPQSAPVIGDLIAKSLDWPGSDEIAKRLQSMLPPQAQDGAKPPQLMQAEQAIQQLQQQIQQMGGQLQQATQQLNDKQGDMQIRQGELQIKAQEQQLKGQELQLKMQDAQVKQFDAETKRMQAQAVAPETPIDDHSFDAWKLESQASFDKWQTEFKEQQANLRKQMDIEAAERLELIKQQQQPVLAQEIAEPEEEYDPETGVLIEKPEEVLPPDPLVMLAQMHGELMAHLAKPKTIIRDANGRALGVQ